MIQLAYIDTQDGHKQKKRYIQPSNLLGKGFGVHLKDGGSFYFKCTGQGFVGRDTFVHYISGFDTEGNDIQIDLQDIDMVTGVDVNE
jgi:hypothetical protein